MGPQLRPPGWERRLDAVLSCWRGVECVRTANCADFAADVVEAVSGRDVRGELGLPVRSAAEVARLYRRLGARQIGDVLTSVLGPSVAPAYAQRGDLVLAQLDPSIGVCIGESMRMFGDRGMIDLPRLAVRLAWRV